MKTIYGRNGMMVADSEREQGGAVVVDMKRLAGFITTNFPGDLGADWLADEGTVDVAIRLLEQMTMMG